MPSCACIAHLDIVQAPIKSIELINALKACLATSQQLASGEATDSSKVEVLVGEECLAIKQEIHFKEQILLREILFKLTVDSSLKYLLNFAKTTNLQPCIVQLAAFLCNDSLVYTNVCQHFEAPDIAIACITAAHLLFNAKAATSVNSVDFAAALELSQTKVDDIVHLLMDLLESRLLGNGP